MKTALIRANHGNHTGFNRKWSLVNIGTMAENKRLIKSYKEEIEDNHRFTIVSQRDIDSNFFDGGANGYFPACLKGVFENR